MNNIAIQQLVCTQILLNKKDDYILGIYLNH